MGVPPPAYEQQETAMGAAALEPVHPQLSGSPPPQQPIQPLQPVQSTHAETDASMNKQSLNQHGSYQGQQSNHQQPQAQYHANQQSQSQQTGPYPIPLASLMSSPAWVNCPNCHGMQMTRVEYVAGTTTHLWALGFCLCFCLGCIPYCISGLKNAEHHCGQCGVVLAEYKRGSGTEVRYGQGPPAVQQTPNKQN